MPMTDIQIRRLKPQEKPYKVADERGLFILVNPNGSKLWRLKYRFEGKEKTLALGAYPDVPLAAARKVRDAAREQLAQDIDPGLVRKVQRLTRSAALMNSFEAVAREWHARNAPIWAPSHADKIIRRLERDLFPWIGKVPIADITPPELLAALRRIEARGTADTAHRAKQNAGQVFRYAVATGRAERDPSADLRGALPPIKKQHFAALTEADDVGGLLRAIDGFRGTQQVWCALRLAPLLFVRPGELRMMEWKELDLDGALWTIPAGKMKKRRDHLVPLSAQALAIIAEMAPFSGHAQHVFQGARDHKRPMSQAAINAALQRMGYDTRTEITGHGFRAMARTILHETLGFPVEVIEHQLAHRVPDALGAAYNRTKFLPQRRTMMQRWADHLDELRAGAGLARGESSSSDGTARDADDLLEMT